MPAQVRDPRTLTLNKLSTMPERELEAWLRCERAEVDAPSSPTYSLKSCHSEMAGFGHRSGRKVGKLLKRGDYAEHDDLAPSSSSNLKESRQMTVHLCKRHLTYHFSRQQLRSHPADSRDVFNGLPQTSDAAASAAVATAAN
ncbi:hypothetical protein RQP46_001129 [Phenoliferia psychrophenolica]